MTAGKSPITTHVLDTSIGRPARGIAVALARRDGEAFVELGRGTTDADGRVTTLLPPGKLVAGTYRLAFAVGAYFAAGGRAPFYPHVEIAFTVAATDEHYHVPLLLSPFGYSTYRGS
jgi:5-hydroxyisourate hydrolase